MVLNKYSLFHIFKWSCMLYEMAVLYELIIVTCFWSMIFPALLVRMNRESGAESYDYSYMFVAGMCDHSVPLICLLVEFSFSCSPFIWRHFLVTGFFAFSYAIFNAVFSLFFGQIYPLIDWRSLVGIYTPICVAILSVAIQHLLINSTKKRLRRHNKHHALDQYEKMFEQIRVGKVLKA